MGKHRFGGKRKPLLVECVACNKRFMWLSNGTAYESRVERHALTPTIPLLFVGEERPRYVHSFPLSEYRHKDCGAVGKLRRLSISNPVRKVIGSEKGYEILSCGHRQFPRSDFFGQTIATARQCMECGRERRVQAVRDGLLSAGEAEL